MNIKIIVFFIAAFFYFQSFAQERALTVGDQVNFREADQILDHTGKIIKLEELNGKYIILDFWSTWCVPCVASFPTLDSLQGRFEGKLSIYPITREDQVHIGSFWESNVITKELTITSIVSDSFFHTLFPHHGVPHVVWIDNNRTVKAITTSQYINEENVEKFLKGDDLGFPIKDHLNSFEPPERLVEQLSFDDNQSFSISITNAINAAQPSINVFLDTVSMMERHLFINQPILNLYRNVLDKMGYSDLMYPSRLILLTSDSSRFIYNKNDEYFETWLAENTLCMELNVPKHILEKYAYSSIIPLLNTFCELDAGIKKMTVDCFEIIGVDKEVYKKTVTRHMEAMDDLNGITLSKLVSSANMRAGNTPVLIQDPQLSNYVVKMAYKYKPAIDSADLEEMLAESGFLIRKQKVSLDMFVINDVGQP